MPPDIAAQAGADAGPPPLLLHRRDGVALLTLARPARGNALSDALVDALEQALDQVLADAGMHTLVLRAQGRHFCTGLDLGDLDSLGDADLVLRLVRIEMLLARLWQAPIRTVAIATGRTWGAGADLFAACEHRWSDASANFRFPGANFGLVLGTRRLAERVGVDTARRWVLESTAIDAELALASGLASARIDTPRPDPLPADTEPWLDRLASSRIDAGTAAALRSASRADHSDADLAALVRSAARPGLVARIVAYRKTVSAG